MTEQDTRRTSALQAVSVAMTERGLELRSLDEALRFANGLIKAGMVPRGIQHEGGVVAIIQAGAELGFSPMWALQSINWINGKIGVGGDASLALIRARGGFQPGTDLQREYFGEPFTPGWGCRVKTWKRGHEDWLPHEEFTLGDAINAGLARISEGRIQTHARQGGWGFHDAPWSRWPKRMLYYRALGFHLRDHYSELLQGCYLREELEDSTRAAEVARSAGTAQPAERDVTPPQGEPQGDQGDALFLSSLRDGGVVDADVSEPEVPETPLEPPQEPPQEPEPEPAGPEPPAQEPKPPQAAPEPTDWREDPRWNQPGDDQQLSVETQKVVSEVFRKAGMTGQKAVKYCAETIGRKIKQSSDLLEGEAWYLIGALAPDRLPESRQRDTTGEDIFN